MAAGGPPPPTLDGRAGRRREGGKIIIRGATRLAPPPPPPPRSHKEGQRQRRRKVISTSAGATTKPNLQFISPRQQPRQRQAANADNANEPLWSSFFSPTGAQVPVALFQPRTGLRGAARKPHERRRRELAVAAVAIAAAANKADRRKTRAARQSAHIARHNLNSALSLRASPRATPLAWRRADGVALSRRRAPSLSSAAATTAARAEPGRVARRRLA